MVLKANYINGETLSASAFNDVATEVNANTTQLASGNFSAAVTATRFVSNVATGTAPLTVASTTNVPNLNASLLQGFAGNASAVGNTFALRDVSGYLTARNFNRSFTTQATAGTTTTLTAGASSAIQEFTGTLAQTVVLPTTGVVAGQQYVIINNSSSSITVQSSGLNSIAVLGSNATTRLTALVATPTTAAHWDADNGNASTLTGLSPAASGSINTIAARNANGALEARGYVTLLTSTATAAGTTTLTVASFGIQQFTGTTTQTCVLPTTGIVAGQTFTIINSSTGAVTVQSSALAAIGAALTTGTSAEFIALVATPTTAAHWHRK